MSIFKSKKHQKMLHDKAIIIQLLIEKKYTSYPLFFFKYTTLHSFYLHIPLVIVIVGFFLNFNLGLIDLL